MPPGIGWTPRTKSSRAMPSHSHGKAPTFAIRIHDNRLRNCPATASWNDIDAAAASGTNETPTRYQSSATSGSDVDDASTHAALYGTSAPAHTSIVARKTGAPRITSPYITTTRSVASASANG